MQKYILILLLFSRITQAAQEAPNYPFQLVQVEQPIPVATYKQACMFFNKLCITDKLNELYRSSETELIPDLNNIVAEYDDALERNDINKRLVGNIRYRFTGCCLGSYEMINPQGTLKLAIRDIGHDLYYKQGDNWLFIRHPKAPTFIDRQGYDWCNRSYSINCAWTPDGHTLIYPTYAGLMMIDCNQSFSGNYYGDSLENAKNFIHTDFDLNRRLLSFQTHHTDSTLIACGYEDGKLSIYKKDQNNRWLKITEKTNIFSTKSVHNLEAYNDAREGWEYKESRGKIAYIYWDKNTNHIFVVSFFEITYFDWDPWNDGYPLERVQHQYYTYGEIFKFKLVPTQENAVAAAAAAMVD